MIRLKFYNPLCVFKTNLNNSNQLFLHACQLFILINYTTIIKYYELNRKIHIRSNEFFVSIMSKLLKKPTTDEMNYTKIMLMTTNHKRSRFIV